MKNHAQIAAELRREWVKAGKLHFPPDDTSKDDDRAFALEVKRRYEAQKDDDEG